MMRLAALAAALAFLPAQAAEPTGSVKGTVRIKGPVPKPSFVKTSADPSCAKLHKGSEIQVEDLVADPKGNLRWAFVYLKKAPPGKFEPPKTAVVVDQRLCRFEPRVLGIMVGQDLKIRNNDSLMHISHVVPNSNREWGFSQAKPGDEKIKVFSAREVMIRMGCDVHPWMVAWIGVLDHPFYAVTDALGQFEIKNIPPGTYTLEVWHEKFKSVSEEIEIKPRETKTSEFTLTERS